MTTYRSTRGGASGLAFSDVLLEGLAPDGGLYLPNAWPVLEDVRALAGQPFGAVAARVLSLFAPDLPEADIAFACEAYEPGGAFAHPAVAPLVQTGPDDFTLELWRDGGVRRSPSRTWRCRCWGACSSGAWPPRGAA